MSSIVVGYLISLSQGSSAKGGGSSPQFEVGLIKRLPWKEPSNTQKDFLTTCFFKICNMKISILKKIETSEWFELEALKPSGGDFIAIHKETISLLERQRIEIRSVKNQINDLVCDLYGLKFDEWRDLLEELSDEILPENFADYFGDGLLDTDLFSLDKLSHSIISCSLGKLFERSFPKVSKETDLNIENFTLNMSSAYSYIQEKSDNNSNLCIFEDSINLYSTLSQIAGEDTITTLLQTSNSISLSNYFCNVNLFFDRHLKSYSTHRRQAPIYWPLQTISGSYTLWIYYHRLNEQTLYTCVNNFVELKLNSVNDNLLILINKPTRTKDEEKEFDYLSDLKIELEDFRDELLRIAKFWKPNLNDGVQITAAPLWRLFQHKTWQKKLKETWEQLEAGDFDWAHIAYSIWPVRVLHKCHKDRSLAIAHEVEHELWHEVEVIKGRSRVPVLEWQPKALSEAELAAYIQSKIQA
jgi:hypothetical protein